MTTYTLLKNNPSNTVLTDPDGNVVYKISTPFKFPSETTTITRADDSDIVAIIYWNAVEKNAITINGITQKVNDVFPKTSKMGSSRLVMTGDGETFKWNYTTKLYCMSEATGLNVATYYRIWFADRRTKKSTIDIAPCAVKYADILVVSWMIMERESEE
ncbi:unnamed protein product [Rhizoctonia solani]|uniref:DUF6593 domain-containing protein n=1 Tax=Rhizoctonia solani TaxID=456999 RepID=A0A8H2Y6Y8_9AGAM|nr:unnamed protein product [Rhizoctonia solani]